MGKERSRLYLSFHWRDFPEDSLLAIQTHFKGVKKLNSKNIGYALYNCFTLRHVRRLLPRNCTAGSTALTPQVNCLSLLHFTVCKGYYLFLCCVAVVLFPDDDPLGIETCRNVQCVIVKKYPSKSIMHL
jgi:hypothetical protein